MNDSVLKTIGVAFVICLVSSLVVSFTAVSLRDLQNENATNNQSKKILQAANLYNPDEDIKSQFEKLEQKFVDFSTGKIIDTYNDFDINDYDQIAATRDSNLSTKLSSTEDIAIIKNRENVGKFFI
jgi:Na+-transporting NADH:ubiquinone oxidoreductase subunit C